jgi:uncharacterized protein YndB with AHSA1/START domain
MKMLKTLIRGLLFFAILFGVVGMILPKATHVEREVVVARPAAEVFAMLNSFRRFNEWSPWFARDPKADYTYTGPAAGVGASMRWVSQQSDVGSGQQTIMESKAPTQIVVKLEFEGQSDARATYTLTPQDGGTRVVWAFDTEHGLNPLSRWFGLLFDRLIGPDYEQGLSKLKTVMESSGVR